MLRKPRVLIICELSLLILICRLLYLAFFLPNISIVDGGNPHHEPYYIFTTIWILAIIGIELRVKFINYFLSLFLLLSISLLIQNLGRSFSTVLFETTRVNALIQLALNLVLLICMNLRETRAWLGKR